MNQRENTDERLNGYLCRKCLQTTYTIDIVEGVTPFMIDCPACGAGVAVSLMYRVPTGVVPTHEFYRPSEKWARRKGPDMLDHVRRGGLVLRERKLETSA